jgi:hypothetical protein
MSKYKSVFQARDKEKEDSGNLEIQKSRSVAKNEKMVNLGIKTEEYKRRYWVGQAKLKGKTISELIVNALTKELGEPE